MQDHTRAPITQHLALVICMSLAAMAPVFAQEATKQQAEAALKEFQTFAKHNNAHVRKAAVDTLGGTDHHLVTSQLLELLKDDAEEVRAAAIQGLEKQTNKQGVQDLVQRAWRGQNKPERVAILKAFQRSRPPLAYNVLQDLVQVKEWEIRAAAAEAIANYPDDDGKGIGALMPLLDDAEPLVRLAALDGLALLGNPRAQTAALKGIADKDWRVRAAAIRVMRMLRQKSSIEPLIGMLKSENGRLVDDSVQALQDLTGREMKGDHEHWMSWWNNVKEGFKVLTKEELADAKKKAEAGRKGYDPPKRGEYAPYHGIKTRSRNMLFVIDVSASMAELVTLDERDKLAMDDFHARYGDLRIKIDIAREELIKLVHSLPGYARFNIITFNSKVQTWQNALVPADDSNKNAAIKYLARLTVASVVQAGADAPGRTNTFDALNAAFGTMKGSEAGKNTYKTDADTMFLLSDGMPTCGRITEPQTLLDYVTTVNRRAKMVIHCVAFGSSNKALMETMALQNGGVYQKIGN